MTAHIKVLSFILFPMALILPLLTGCQPAPATALEGHYTLEAQSVQINGTIINIGDWPGSSVTISAVDDEAVLVSIDSLLPGFDTLSVQATAAAAERKDRYTFSGTYSGQDRDITVSGTVNGSALSLSITDICTSPLTGRWTVARDEEGQADISVTYSSPAVTEITLGDIKLPVDTAVQLLESLLRQNLTPLLDNLGYIWLDRTGYLNISWRGDISPELEPLLTGVVQYWPAPDDFWIHLYLRRTITDAIGSPVSPIDLALAYSIDGSGSPVLEINQDTSDSWAGILILALGSMDGSDPIASIVKEIAQSLLLPETAFSISVRLSPVQ